jgi:hypothetical protein
MQEMQRTESYGFARDAELGIRASSLAQDLYHAVLWRARLGKWWAVLTRRQHLLLSLNGIDRMEVDRGNQFSRICTVPVRQIRGSEGRIVDFDAEFRPLHKRTQGRWLGMATAYLNGITLPPVELIQVGDSFFVRDGHHRVSVARAMGQEYIEAEVTILEGDQLPTPTYQDWNCHILAG